MHTLARHAPQRLLLTIATILLLSIAFIQLDAQAWISPQITIIEPDHPKISYQHKVGLNVSLGNSEWGKRGQITKKMIQWAESLARKPDDVDKIERASFQAALLRLLPFLADTETSVFTPRTFSTDGNFSSDVGIVICAGSNNFHLAAHLIRNLRRVLGSKLPIEIAFAGENDLQLKHRKFLAREGVVFIDLLNSFPAARQDLENSSWAMKPFALLASSHTRTILIDADAIFLSSPDDIFESNPDLNRTGLLLFHDRASGGRGGDSLDWLKAQMKSANITISSYLATQSLFYSGAATYEADSGVLAIDKTRPSLMLGLLFATWMNTKHVREEITYKFFQGDKETFWIAMELANVDYSFQPWYAGSIGKIGTDQTSEYDPSTIQVVICGKHMLHLDHLGQQPLWFNGGIYKDKDSPETGFGELTHFWSGRQDEIPHWYWKKGSFACVNVKNVYPLSDLVKNTLDLTRVQVLEVDDLIRAL